MQIVHRTVFTMIAAVATAGALAPAATAGTAPIASNQHSASTVAQPDAALAAACRRPLICTYNKSGARLHDYRNYGWQGLRSSKVYYARQTRNDDAVYFAYSAPRGQKRWACIPARKGKYRTYLRGWGYPKKINIVKQSYCASWVYRLPSA